MQKIFIPSSPSDTCMKRKVVLHGPSTLTVSLPSAWTQRHRIKKGTDLEITTKDDRLIISPAELTEYEHIHINLEDLDRTFAKLFIRSAYRKGFDTIDISYKDPNIPHIRTGRPQAARQIILSEAKQLIGFEVTDIRERGAEIRNLTTDRPDDFNRVLRNSFQHLSQFSKDLVGSMQTNKLLPLDIVEERHGVTEKFINYCLRLLNKKETLPPRQERILYHIISSVDAVNNIYKWFYRDGVLHHKPFHAQSLAYCVAVNRYLDTFIQLFYHTDNKSLSAIGCQRKDLRMQLAGLADDLPGSEILLLAELKEIVEILYLLAVTLMELHHESNN